MAATMVLGVVGKDGLAQIKVRVQDFKTKLQIKQGTGLYINESIWAVKGKVDFPQIGFEKGTTERGFSKVSKSV